MTRRSTTTGTKTKAAILKAAADVASVEGLDGLSIGRLATDLAMSKSGLFAHFGSKEELQLATIGEAEERYAREVIEPALASPPGIRQLRALCEAFLSYVERGVFPGGCFFAGAMAEYGPRPDGPVRDRVAGCQEKWLRTLARAAQDGQASGELRADGDVRQLAFELEAAMLSANWYFRLYADPGYLDRARRAIRARLAAEATETGQRALPNDIAGG